MRTPEFDLNGIGPIGQPYLASNSNFAALSAGDALIDAIANAVALNSEAWPEFDSILITDAWQTEN